MNPRRLLVLLAALVLGLGGCSATKETVRLEVSPAATRMDEPFSVRVTGLSGAETVDLVLHSIDAQGTTWVSRATFVADAAGTVDPGTAPPTGGSYAGVDAMGLVSSLLPQGSGSSYRWPDVGPANFVLDAEQDGRTVASATVARTFWPEKPTTRVFTEAADGFVGTYVRPAGVQRGPAVLALGGSEGGDPLVVADILASRGIPTLSVAYFGAPGLPKALARIPLEYFDTPLRWLRSQPEVDPERLWIAGGSRGSEAAALVASGRPGLVHGLLDLSPASVPGCAYDPAGKVPCPGPAWTRDGKAVAHTVQLNGAGAQTAQQAGIPVEKIDGPVLTLCGGADLVWDSCRFSESIQTRLKEHGFTHPTLALAYPDAGHLIDLPIPYLPIPPTAAAALPTYGSTPLANDQARAQAWPRLLAFVTG